MAINFKGPVVNGILAANIFAIPVATGSLWIARHFGDGSDIIITSVFLVTPIAMGLISSYFWNKIQLRGYKYMTYSLINYVLIIGWSYFILKEGVI